MPLYIYYIMLDTLTYLQHLYYMLVCTLKCVSEATWSYLELPEATWSYMELSGAICSYLELSDLELCGAIWSYLVLSAALCSCLQLSGAIWSYLHGSGAIWTNLQTPKPPKTQNPKPTIQIPKHTTQKAGGRRKRR